MRRIGTSLSAITHQTSSSQRNQHLGWKLPFDLCPSLSLPWLLSGRQAVSLHTFSHQQSRSKTRIDPGPFTSAPSIFILLLGTFGTHKTMRPLLWFLYQSRLSPPPPPTFQHKLGRSPLVHSGNASRSVSDVRKSTVSSSSARRQHASAPSAPAALRLSLSAFSMFKSMPVCRPTKS